MKFIWLLILFLFTVGATAAVKDPVYDEFEGLDLVEALIRDGRFELAETELKKARESVRRTRLLGDLAYARQNFSSALLNYSRLPQTPEHSLLLARTSAQLKKDPECVSHFKDSESLWQGATSDVIFKASCEFRRSLYRAAHSTLTLGYRKHKGFSLQRERVSLLLEMALSQSALQAALERGSDTTAAQTLALAELFHDKKMDREMLILLEWARTRFPFDVDVNLSLAKAYFGKGQLRVTAEAFERAARVDRKFAYHAAELRRQLGDKQTAAYWLPQIDDEKEKLRARLASYVDNGWYSLIASLDGLVASSPLNQDDEVRYAMGYALFRQGQTTKPLKYLSLIRSPHHIERAALLKKSIIECRASSASCRM